jgi:hypothetical protein
MLEKLKEKAIDFGFEEKLVNSITFKYNPKFNINGILGRYCPIRKTIEIAHGIAFDVIFPTVVHELVHALQRDTMGLIPYLMALTLQRKRIEEDARFLEEQLYELFDLEARRPIKIVWRKK